MAIVHSELVIDDVYARLHGMVVSNVLRSGQKLVDRELAELLGVSRTPVREALGRLAMTGLIENRARRGYYVSRFSADQISDLYEFRVMLEVNAATLAARHARSCDLDEFERILGDLSSPSPEPSRLATAVRLDLEIHDLIARASGNRSLHQAIRSVLDKVMCFVSVEIANREALATAYHEHHELFRLIKRREEEGAADLIRMHVDNARKNLVDVFQARDDLHSSVMATTRS